MLVGVDVVGSEVEFPTALGEYQVGHIVAYDTDTGAVIVEDCDGQRWKGFEYQLGLPV